MPEKKDFLPLFKTEAVERLLRISNGIVELEKNPRQTELVRDLNREAHSIKGAARMLGFFKIQDIAHGMEDRFEKIAAGKGKFTRRTADEIFREIDAVRVLLDEAVGKKTDDAGVPAKSQPAEEYVHIALSKINPLLNLAGEMVISKMQGSGKILKIKNMCQTAKALEKGILDLTNAVLKSSLQREVHISNTLSRCAATAAKMKEMTADLYDHLSTEMMHQDPIIDELQGKTKELRMLPCETIFAGFPRMIRDIAGELKKDVQLKTTGEQIELDKKVLEGIKAPLMHLLRNSVDHGIELPKERKKMGKSPAGTICLCARQEAGKVILEVSDDGRGMDAEEVKETALFKNLVSAEELGKMHEKEILNLVFMNGYSTSSVITDVSGRGIGLDIVASEMRNLKGQVFLESEKNKGSKFSLVLPLTIAVTNVLLVQTNGRRFGFPMVSVNECLDVKADDISTLEGCMAISLRGLSVPIVKLCDVLNLPEGGDGDGQKNSFPAVITSSFEKRVGFIVDRIAGEEEVFIKNLGKHLGKVKNFSGAVILGTGEVVPVFDMADLLASSRLAHPAAMGKRPSAEKKRKKRILVVEDVLTTREFIKSILEAQNYLVETAVDGLDALSKMAEKKFDLIVSDIQMPRMNGFELCQKVKQSAQHKDIPVAMVTALESEEDKRKGIEAGASAYIVKSTFDQANLLDAVERLIG